jgi:ABC-type nitrate/sulfonate/bicarbonate transport system substrate-binding protein
LLSSSARAIRVGFVALADAAPLLIAHECGYFADEGLQVSVERQIGWGNVRDKLVYGHLHASHALFGMPPLSVLRHERFSEPLVCIVALGSGKNGITLSRKWTDAGVDSAAALGQRLRSRMEDAPVFAHVFGCSIHHYLLRNWLVAGGINPDRQVRLITLPPPQMIHHTAAGTVDGYCVGEPWNTVAEAQGLGRVVATPASLSSTDPDKVLAVSRRWLASHGAEAESLVRAILRGCAFCERVENAGRVAEILSQPGYLDIEAALLECFTEFRWRGGDAGDSSARPIPTGTFPEARDVIWLLKQMVRWGHLPSQTDVVAIANACIDTTPYQRALETAGFDRVERKEFNQPQDQPHKIIDRQPVGRRAKQPF